MKIVKFLSMGFVACVFGMSCSQNAGYDSYGTKGDLINKNYYDKIREL